MPVSKTSRPSLASSVLEAGAVVAALAALSAAALASVHARGWLLYYGDAQAHLNIARRILDSRTPGYDQIGTVWLPLPHVLMLPLVGDAAWWTSGLAGAVPSALCFVAAGAFLYFAARRAFASRAAAVAATALLAANPNLLYLQSTAMTETLFLAALLAMLWATLRFRETQSLGAVVAAALASAAASLTRYEGWFLIPFVAAYFLFAARRHRLRAALLFGVLASLAPLYWLAHNWWGYGNFLEFYNGPYSAQAIYQRALAGGMARYPGDGDWGKACLYFRVAAGLVAGWPLAWLAAAGAVAALLKRTFWPLLLLALPPAFYVWSLHSGSTPIFVPELWPFTYYNTRYGLAALPLLAFAAASLVRLAPARAGKLAALVVVAAGAGYWVANPQPERWTTWKESQVNSEARRVWTREAAGFLRARQAGSGGVLFSFGDLAGIFPEAGIPLARTLHEGNVPLWEAAVARPDLFLWEEWAVAMSGDQVATALLRAQRKGPRYSLEKSIAVKGAPVIEIYRRER